MSNMGRDGATTSRAHDKADSDRPIDLRDVRARLAYTAPRPPAERKRPERRAWVALRKTQHRNNGGGADAVKATGWTGRVELREGATRGLAHSELDMSARGNAAHPRKAEQGRSERENITEQVPEKISEQTLERVAKQVSARILKEA